MKIFLPLLLSLSLVSPVMAGPMIRVPSVRITPTPLPPPVRIYTAPSPSQANRVAPKPTSSSTTPYSASQAHREKLSEGSSSSAS